MALPKKNLAPMKNCAQAAPKSSHSMMTPMMAQAKLGINQAKTPSASHKNAQAHEIIRKAPTSSISAAGLPNSALPANEPVRNELSLVKKDHKKRQIKDRQKTAPQNYDPKSSEFKTEITFKSGFQQGIDRGWMNPQNINLLKACDSWDIADLYSRSDKTHPEDLDETSDTMNSDMLLLEESPLKPVLEDKSDILSWAVTLLSASPTARLMLKEAQSNDWRIGLEDLDGPDFHLDVPEKLIILSNQGFEDIALGRSTYFCNMMIIGLIRALRDVWQEKRYGAFDENFGPEAVLTLERIRAADLDVIAVLVAWELRSEGNGDLWRHMLGGDDGDLAMRFSACLEREPASQFTNKALAKTFTQWFLSDERVNACDHETLDYLDSVIASAYHANPFGKQRVTPVTLERISCLPNKTAYLQGLGQSLLSDPLYAGMNDEINQSHLMHLLYDLRVTYVQNVPFRDESLAAKIFPNGLMTPENEDITRH